MNEFLLYLLNSTLSLSLLYLLFRIILRKETVFKLNRVILLLIVLCSIGIPILNSPFEIHNPVKMLAIPAIGSDEISQQDFTGIEKIDNPKQSNISHYSNWEFIPSIPQLLLYTYLSGCLIALLILIYGLIRIRILFKKAQILTRENYLLLIIDQEISAFSFGHCIFISKSDFENHSSIILAHEQEHIRLHHFYDLILLETLKILHWYNPAIYWLIRDMKDIHEFQADTYALTTGIDVTQYQLLIIQKGVGSQRFALANSFNQFQIKKRITMMNKQKSGKAPIWKVAIFLPLFALLLMAFGRQDENKFSINSKLPEMWQESIQDTIQGSNGSKAQNKQSLLNKEVNYTADNKITIDTLNKKIYLYKNAQVKYKNIEIKADYIELNRDSNSVFAKGNSILKKGNNEFKADEIRYNLLTGKSDLKVPNKVSIVGNAEGISINKSHGKSLTHADLINFANKHISENPPLILLEGKIIDRVKLAEINPSEVVSIHWMIYNRAIEKYGERAKNGAIQILLKKNSGTSNGKNVELVNNREQQKEDKSIYKAVDEIPQFHGGEKALMSFIRGKIRYPAEAMMNNEQGRVIINLVIDHFGKVKNPIVFKGVSPLLDAEAIRVINLLPDWIPGKQKGKTVDVSYTIPIEFKIEAPEIKSDEKNVELVINKEQQKEDKSIDKAVDEMAQFYGGEKALLSFIRGKIRYPVESMRNNEQGRVIINLVIDRSGKVKNPKVFRGVSTLLDAEAIRVISLLPDWIPGKQKGKAVDVSYMIPIEFKIEAAEKKSDPQGAPFSKWEVGHSIKIDLNKP